MIKYGYGVLLRESAPLCKSILRPNVNVFMNTDKIRNVVPFVSTLISYIPFFTGDTDKTFIDNNEKFRFKFFTTHKKFSRLNVKIVGIESNFDDDFNEEVPDFLKAYKDAEFSLKYFPDHYAKFYLKEYSVGTLQSTSFEKFNSELLGHISQGDDKKIKVEYIKSYEVDIGLSCFEAKYIQN
jgi:hypothetical protein